jgi:hypothetical protein
MRRLLALLLGLLVVLAWEGRAQATEVILLTIGPSPYLFSRYGHTIACIKEDGGSDAACYDYGIPDAKDATDMAWGGYRGRANFTVQRFPMTTVVDAYKDQERNIEQQRLNLTQDQAKKVAELFERDAADKHHYVYHPYYANCTTKVRDALDLVTGGKLRENEHETDGPLFRQLSEEPLAGEILELSLMSIMLGTPAERRPTTWEAQFLPTGLRDAVRDRLGAMPETLHDRKPVRLPMTPHGGRIAVGLVGLVMALVLLRRARKADATWKRARTGAGVVLGLFGLLVDFVAVTCAIPEFTHNWALLLLTPTDFALAFLSGPKLRWYLTVRLGVSAALFALSLAGLVHQQLVAPFLLAALPLGITLLRERGWRAKPAAVVPATSA